MLSIFLSWKESEAAFLHMISASPLSVTAASVVFTPIQMFVQRAITALLTEVLGNTLLFVSLGNRAWQNYLYYV